MSNGKSIARKSLQRGSKKGSSTGRQSSGIFADSTPIGPNDIEAWLTSLQADSPASLSALPANGPEPMMNGTCGLQQSRPFAWFDRDTACWRTFQGSLFRDTLELFSATWPKAGMIADGESYRQPKWERRISATACGFWRTPNSTVIDAKSSVKKLSGRTPQDPQVGLADQVKWRSPQRHNALQGPKSREHYEKCLETRESQITLTDQVKHYPTPTKADASGHAQTADNPTPGQTGGTTLPGAVKWLALQTRDWKGTSQRFSRGNTKDCLPNAVGGTQTPPTYLTPKTPTGGGQAVRKSKGGGLRKLEDQVVANGQLNPEWVEWLMGVPIGWTDLKPLAICRFQRWERLHGGS